MQSINDKSYIQCIYMYIERERGERVEHFYIKEKKKRESNAVISVQLLSKQKSFLITQLRCIINFGTLKDF